MLLSVCKVAKQKAQIFSLCTIFNERVTKLNIWESIVKWSQKGLSNVFGFGPYMEKLESTLAG